MRLICGLFVSAVLVCAADKQKAPPSVEGSNGDLSIHATLLPDRDAIRQELGSDLGGYFTVLRVEVAPKAGKTINVYRDDFTLRSYKDGQKSQPFAPSQIAGRGAMVVSSGPGGGIVGGDDRGPAWGGIPGTGGRPHRLPGMGGGGVGTAATASGTAEAKVDTGAKAKEDPLLAVLKQKVLPEKETKEPLTGLLYFSLEGKHRPKDLVLQYTGASGKITMEFK